MTLAMMRKPALAIAAASVLTLAGCLDTMSNRDTAGAALGGAAGLVTAAALDANAGWTILTTLGGAAAGVLVARNTASNRCAYSNGDGTYRTAPC